MDAAPPTATIHADAVREPDTAGAAIAHPGLPPDRPVAIPLVERGVVAVTGPDRKSFLQGLVSNDIHAVAPGHAVYAALLTPQGKYLHDFFVFEQDEALLLETDRQAAPDLLRRLKPFKLRSKVTLEDQSGGFAVTVLMPASTAVAVTGLATAEPGAAGPWCGGTVFVDPRHAHLGVRAVLPSGTVAVRDALAEAGFGVGSRDIYEGVRLSLGVPDGRRDMSPEKSTLLESNLDVFNGISWDKGCYMGQELTARMHYRGLLKKRLLPVRVEGPLPAAGTPIHLDGAEVGELRSGCGDRALALLRLEAVQTAAARGLSFAAGEACVIVEPPTWLADA